MKQCILGNLSASISGFQCGSTWLQEPTTRPDRSLQAVGRLPDTSSENRRQKGGDQKWNELKKEKKSEVDDNPRDEKRTRSSRLNTATVFCSI